ncbi:MAG TPA: RNA methyltransferase [Burkholderiales bacterium]|nr:RNA methyltransferase [Burkholderiales bacterium]
MNPTNPLDNVRIVLVHPTHPGNIGAAARAMKAMGLGSLYLVNPGRFPDREADALASGALDLLGAARICASLDEALSGTVLAVALTARPREFSHAAHNPREAAGILLEEAGRSPVAVVFGSEMSGLSNEEVIKCRMVVHIPANPQYSSLNLAAAVQVMCYELRLAAVENERPQQTELEPANFEEIEMFYHHLEEVMIARGFMNPEQPKRLMERLRRLFGRAHLEKEEVSILRGILKSLQK